MKDRLVKSLETQFIMIKNTAANTTITTITHDDIFSKNYDKQIQMNLMDITNILFLFAKQYTHYIANKEGIMYSQSIGMLSNQLEDRIFSKDSRSRAYFKIILNALYL